MSARLASWQQALSPLFVWKSLLKPIYSLVFLKNLVFKGSVVVAIAHWSSPQVLSEISSTQLLGDKQERLLPLTRLFFVRLRCSTVVIGKDVSHALELRTRSRRAHLEAAPSCPFHSLLQVKFHSSIVPSPLPVSADVDSSPHIHGFGC